MSPLPCRLRKSRSVLVGVASLTLLSLVAACGDTPRDVWFLGPVDAGWGEVDAGPDQQSPPIPATLGFTACSTGALVGADDVSVVRSVGVLGDRAVVASANGVSAWRTDSLGCPSERITTFGEGGTLALDASAASPATGGRVIATTSDGVRLFNANGEVTGSCKLSSDEVAARMVAMRGDGVGVAGFARSPLYKLVTDSASPGACNVTAVPLSPEPFAIAAIAPAFDGKGWVVVEQTSASSPLVVAWYDLAGARLAQSPASTSDSHPAHLCSGVGLADTAAGVVVADASCGRVVLFDSKSRDAVGELRVDGTPRGVGPTSDGNALVAVARPIEDGAIATFVVIQLP